MKTRGARAWTYGDALNAEENLELVKRYQASSGRREKREVEAKIVRGNMGIIRKVASDYISRAQDRFEMTDLEQEGAMGLLRALALFDPNRETAFTTYAKYWITHYIHRKTATTTTLGRVPNYAIERHAKPEIVEAVKRVMSEPLRDVTDLPLLSRERSAHHVCEFNEESHLLRAALESLPPRSAMILSRRYGLEGRMPEPLHVLAKDLGLCRERVRQIQLDALTRLREALSAIA